VILLKFLAGSVAALFAVCLISNAAGATRGVGGTASFLAWGLFEVGWVLHLAVNRTRDYAWFISALIAMGGFIVALLILLQKGAR
jgi:hypothetical protein